MGSGSRPLSLLQPKGDLYPVVQVVQAFKILTSDKQVKAILVNIFGARPHPVALPGCPPCVCASLTCKPWREAYFRCESQSTLLQAGS